LEKTQKDGVLVLCEVKAWHLTGQTKKNY